MDLKIGSKNSGPTSSCAMTNFMVALTSSFIKLVNATIKFFGLRTRGHGQTDSNIGFHGEASEMLTSKNMV
jgi:hypothetical protein